MALVRFPTQIPTLFLPYAKLRDRYSLLGVETVTKLHRGDENEGGSNLRMQPVMMVEMSEVRGRGDE